MEDRQYRLFIFALLVVAAITASFATCSAAEAATRMTRILYRGSFLWDGKTPMELRIGTTHAGQLAEIWSKQGRQAICRVTHLDRQRNGAPVALELSCQASGLGALRTPATLLWPETSPLAYPAIRFGSWLNGYRFARIQVLTDCFARRSTDLASAR
jgi:hypothetical protein